MSRSEAASHSLVDDILRYALAIGATLVLLLPAARGHHEALGWLPMWLLAMPLSAWGALWLARRSGQTRASEVLRAAAPRRRRPGTQARRRPRATPDRRADRAA